MNINNIILEEVNNFLMEKLNKISPQNAIDKKLFGPVYHGTTPEKYKNIEKDGFKTFYGDARIGDTSHGYVEYDYYSGIPAPVHHLGYGVYFTKTKAIAIQFNLGSSKNLKEYYLDIQKVETINFGSPKNMMNWWISNGYDPELAKKNRVEATKRLTDTLKSKYDAVWFKGKGGLRSLLDGDQIVVFNPENIYQVDYSLSKGFEIGSKVKRKSDRYNIIKTYNVQTDQIKVSYGDKAATPAGTTGIIVGKRKKRINLNNSWEDSEDFIFDVKWRIGGIEYNINQEELLT